jgi:hypothetical protein
MGAGETRKVRPAKVRSGKGNVNNSPERNAFLRSALAVRKSTSRLLRSIKEMETAREIMERAATPAKAPEVVERGQKF